MPMHHAGTATARIGTFVANGQPHAHITRDGKRWLCYTADDIGDDGLLGLMPTLTAAKAYLARRAFAAMSHVAEREETPL